MITFEPLRLILLKHYSFYKRRMTCVKDNWGLYNFISQIHIAFLNASMAGIWPYNSVD